METNKSQTVNYNADLPAIDGGINNAFDSLVYSYAVIPGIPGAMNIKTTIKMIIIIWIIWM